jgi:hypothetical protein
MHEYEGIAKMDGFVNGFLVLCRTQTTSYELPMMLNVLEMVMQRASWWVKSGINQGLR